MPYITPTQRKVRAARRAYHKALGEIASDILHTETEWQAQRRKLADVPMEGLRELMYDRVSMLDEESIRDLRISTRTRDELTEWLTS